MGCCGGAVVAGVGSMCGWFGWEANLPMYVGGTQVGRKCLRGEKRPRSRLARKRLSPSPPIVTTIVAITNSGGFMVGVWTGYACLCMCVCMCVCVRACAHHG